MDPTHPSGGILAFYGRGTGGPNCSSRSPTPAIWKHLPSDLVRTILVWSGIAKDRNGRLMYQILPDDPRRQCLRTVSPPICDKTYQNSHIKYIYVDFTRTHGESEGVSMYYQVRRVMALDPQDPTGARHLAQLFTKYSRKTDEKGKKSRVKILTNIVHHFDP